MVTVVPPPPPMPFHESSLMYHSTQGLFVQPYMPIIEKPPAVPDFFSANSATIVPRSTQFLPPR